jgi:hypothetical protein
VHPAQPPLARDRCLSVGYLRLRTRPRKPVRLLRADHGAGEGLYDQARESKRLSQCRKLWRDDQIASVGPPRDFSIGPRSHFEGWLNGAGKTIDPVAWLATRGISLAITRD